MLLYAMRTGAYAEKAALPFLPVFQIAIADGWTFVSTKGHAKNRKALWYRIYIASRWLEDHGHFNDRALVRICYARDGVVICRKDMTHKRITVTRPNGQRVELPPVSGSKLAPATKKPNK